MTGRLVVAVGLALACVLATACSQGPGAPSITTGQSASSSRSSQPSSSPLASISPIPPNASRYDSAIDAGIAGVESKTGVTYTGGTCNTAESCLGTPEVFGNLNAGGNDTGYVEIVYSGPPTTTCYAYVIFASGGWHYTQPVVCPQQSGYNPVLGGQDHVNAPGTCANVRSNHALSAKVVTCLKHGTVVSIDPDNPFYADGHIWWSINGHQGWMVHDALITA